MVIPREHGVTYSPFFPVTHTYAYFKNRNQKDEKKPLLNTVSIDDADDLEVRNITVSPILIFRGDAQ